MEEVESVETEFWDEIFERLGSQIKQSLVEYETKYEFDPISIITVITDRKKIKNLSKGIERQLGEIVIKQYNPEDSVEFSNEAQKYLDSLSNKSLASEAIGAASRKLNSFNLETDEIYSINLVSNNSQIKINRRSKSLGGVCMMMAGLFVLIFIGHVVPFKILKLMENSSKLSANSSLVEDLEQKKTLLESYKAKVNKIDSEREDTENFGSNLQTTAMLYGKLKEIVPKDVRLTSYEVKEKTSIIFTGVAKNDQSVVMLMDNLSQSDAVNESRIEAMVEFTQQDRLQLYTDENQPVPDPENLPKETISKKFTSTLSLKPINNEIFDDAMFVKELLENAKG